MQNQEKFIELAQKLGLSPQALEQYMACKQAETNETKTMLLSPKPQQTVSSYIH